MKLAIQNREVKGISVLDLGGRIIFGEECNALREEIKQLLGNKNQKILLNMKEVNYVDSSGVGILVAAHMSAKNQGGQLKLVNLGRKIKETFESARLLTVFEEFSKEAEALASFK